MLLLASTRVDRSYGQQDLALAEEVARIAALAIDNARRLHPDLPVEYCEDVACLAVGCDAVVVVTDWPQYRELDFEEIAKRMSGKLVLDARNYLQPAQVRNAGLEYVGIGR